MDTIFDVFILKPKAAVLNATVVTNHPWKSVVISSYQREI